MFSLFKKKPIKYWPIIEETLTALNKLEQLLIEKEKHEKELTKE